MGELFPLELYHSPLSKAHSMGNYMEKYYENSEIRTPKINIIIVHKWKNIFYYVVMQPKDADGTYGNRVDPDQSCP